HGDCLTMGEYEIQVGLEEQGSDNRPSDGPTTSLLDSDPALPGLASATDEDLLASTQPTGQSPISPFDKPGEPTSFDDSGEAAEDLLEPAAESAPQAPEPPPAQSGGAFEPPQIPEDFDLEWGLAPSEPVQPAPSPPRTAEPAEPYPRAAEPAEPSPRPRAAEPAQPPARAAEPDQPPARAAEPDQPPAQPPEPKLPPAPAGAPIPGAGPATPSQEPSTASKSTGDPLAAFLRGCGLEELPLAEGDREQTMELVGMIFRQMVQGLMETLMARSQIKGEFRLSQTAIRPVENNPLKFSIGAEEAITNLLAPRGSAYMPARQAVGEGFDDLKAHQLAVMAGMQAALNDLLQRFNPAALEERLGRNSGLSGLLPGMRKARYWDLFKVIYGDIADEARENFEERFGREFAQAYEQQIQALKSSGRH
ncbi:MAG: type VI secretion system-associated FHA domain protein TagH, partial [Candidatus Competibacteraceae bacterium]|nr:type VI secretion system-associated FHA domain protein TagH [Candidatus Competibacteraceae bacterium]